MKHSLLLASGLAFTAATANAAISYSTGFEEPTFDPLGDVAGNDGWMINSTVPGISFLNPYDADGIGGNPSSQAGALGGSIDTPGGLGTQVDLTHDVEISLTDFQFNVDFAVLGSSEGFPGADDFGFTLFNGGSELFRVAFETPATGLGDLEIVWYDNVGTRNPLDPGMAIQYGSANNLIVGFSPDGGGADAAFSATISSLNSVTFGGTLIGEGMTTVDSIGVDFDVQTPVSAGDNFIIFDNLAATSADVPDTGSTLALFLSGVALLVGFKKKMKGTAAVA